MSAFGLLLPNENGSYARNLTHFLNPQERHSEQISSLEQERWNGRLIMREGWWRAEDKKGKWRREDGKVLNQDKIALKKKR